LPFVVAWSKDTKKRSGVWLWGMKKDIENKKPGIKFLPIIVLLKNTILTMLPLFFQ
jgi:hypothetical protein